MRFSFRRAFLFFVVLLIPLLVMRVVSSVRERRFTPEKRISKMKEVASKETLTLKDIMDLANLYSSLPKNFAEKEEVREIMKRVRVSYVRFWNSELLKRRKESPEEFYKVSLSGDRGECAVLEGYFDESKIKSLRSATSWLRSLKAMGFERIVIKTGDKRITFLLK